LLALALIAGVAWLLIRLLQVFEEIVARKYRLDENEDVTVRRIRTQAQVFHRVGVVVVVVVTLAGMLMTFPSVRQLGVSLFASAGIAGIVVGIAARPTLSNLIAGMQVALTEPVRIDDVVVVEGEWGHIEEIATTYVVVRIWDQRRLVLPLTYFIEKPFQNWTRASTEILGTVFVYTDYTVPVEAVRIELKRILDATKLWNGKVWGLQVTDATGHGVQLRALMSAADSDSAWDLRCHVREALVDFLQRSYPQSLPKMRAELHRNA
jgi:small-conductance mechanosensitive channel